MAKRRARVWRGWGVISKAGSLISVHGNRSDARLVASAWRVRIYPVRITKIRRKRRAGKA